MSDKIQIPTGYEMDDVRRCIPELKLIRFERMAQCVSLVRTWREKLERMAELLEHDGLNAPGSLRCSAHCEACDVADMLGMLEPQAADVARIEQQSAEELADKFVCEPWPISLQMATPEELRDHSGTGLKPGHTWTPVKMPMPAPLASMAPGVGDLPEATQRLVTDCDIKVCTPGKAMDEMEASLVAALPAGWEYAKVPGPSIAPGCVFEDGVGYEQIAPGVFAGGVTDEKLDVAAIRLDKMLPTWTKAGPACVCKHDASWHKVAAPYTCSQRNCTCVRY